MTEPTAPASTAPDHDVDAGDVANATTEPLDAGDVANATTEPLDAGDVANATTEPQGDTEPGARKYRRRAQEAEAERDALREQVETMRRQRIEDAVGRVIPRPDVLWRLGVEPTTFLDEQGNLLTGKDLRHRAEDVAREHGLVVRAAPDPMAGSTSYGGRYRDFGDMSGAFEPR